jgi:hypothetical protein
MQLIRRLHIPLIKPEDVIPHLAEVTHWREGYSAQELAFSWANSKNHFPPTVKKVLSQAPEYANAKLVDGFFEREVDLRTPGKNSQTDLMVITDLGQELGIIAVEGKVQEPFAEFVNKWNSSDGRQVRLESLCRTLGLDHLTVGELRYQLFHRVASAVYEAQRFHCGHAMMLVHSFSPDDRSFDDFSKFARALGQPVIEPNTCSDVRMFDGVSVRLAWVRDVPRTSTEQKSTSKNHTRSHHE